jgi:hypothetical protein
MQRDSWQLGPDAVRAPGGRVQGAIELRSADGKIIAID